MASEKQPCFVLNIHQWSASRDEDLEVLRQFIRIAKSQQDSVSPPCTRPPSTLAYLREGEAPALLPDGLDLGHHLVGRRLPFRAVSLRDGGGVDQVISRERSSAEGSGASLSVAVLVPARNEAAVIEECIRSLLASDHPRVVIHVISDGSSDATAETCRAHASETLIVHEHLRISERAGPSRVRSPSSRRIS